MISNILNIMKTKQGSCVVSIILGIGIASLFRKSCESRNCMVFHAPPLDKVKSNVFKHDDKCYTFTEKSVQCNSTSKKQVSFA